MIIAEHNTNRDEVQQVKCYMGFEIEKGVLHEKKWDHGGYGSSISECQSLVCSFFLNEEN